MNSAPVIGLEIGTSKVVALVGERRDDGHIMITGMGEVRSIGVRKGEIVDFEKAAGAVRSVIGMAEDSGKVSIGEVILSVSGGHIQGLVNRGTVPVLDPEEGIAEEDIEQVMEVAKSVNLLSDRQVIHSIGQHFCVDGQERVVQPEGMEGAQLSLDMLILHGVRSRLNNTARVVTSTGIHVSDAAFSGLCSALAVLTPQQKKSGAIVIDFGGGTTNYVVYADGIVATAGALGVGGDHVTNDIAQAFNIPTTQAEEVKCRSGAAVVGASPEAALSVPSDMGFPERTLSVRSLHTVIHARMDETLGMIRRRLDDRVLHRIGAGVVVTGGGAQLDKLGALVERVFGLPCVTGCARHVSGLATVTESPAYATASGLVQYGFKASRETGAGGVLKKLLGLIGR